MQIKKLIKLLILKLYAWGYFAIIFAVIYGGALVMGFAEWVGIIAGLAVAISIVFFDKRESTEKEIIKYPASNYLKKRQ